MRFCSASFLQKSGNDPEHIPLQMEQNVYVMPYKYPQGILNLVCSDRKSVV